LQDILGEFDGTVLFVSHDRDFIDRIATQTVAMEGEGRATVYPGGWSDYAAQRPVPQAEPARPAAAKPAERPADRPAKRTEGLTFTERKRFDDLPALMDRLQAEIAKLSDFLAQPDLFTKEPVKFRKASEGLAERQAALAAAEEDWLTLAERA
jgi:ATP-binding cassette subfamily F protein uup